MEHSTSFRSYAFLGKDSLLVITNTGVVLLAKHAKIADNESSVTHSEPLQWKMIDQPRGLQGYSVATAAKSQDSATAFFAGTNGVVYCYNQQCADVPVVARAQGKIAAIFAEMLESKDPSEARTRQQTFSLLITLVGSSTAHHYTVAMLPGGEVSLQRSIPISLPSGFIVTSFVNPTFIDGEEHIFLGGRNGSVAIFSISSQLDPDMNGSTLSATYIRTLERTHAKETVTAMLWVPATSSDHTSFGWLLSVGRDGSCAMLHFSRDDAEPSLVHKLDLPFGPNIEGIYLDATSNDLMVYGFSGKQFVLYNASLEREIWTIECGGAHRVWAFHPTCDPGDPSIQGGAFVWTKAGKMNVFSKHTPSHQIIRQGGHGREIKALAVSPSGGACGQLVATGAEDTDIRLFRYETSSQMFRCLRILRKHVTGIQHLQWSDDGRFLFSSGGFEEFLVWRVRSVPVLGIGVVCEAVCPPESELADLRITHFTARSVHASEEGSRRTDAFVTGMMYSDSTVRIYCYTSCATSKTWILLLMGNYLTSCLTQSAFLSLGDEDTLLTAGTDGHIALWSLPGQLFSSQPRPTVPESPVVQEGHPPNTVEWHTRTKIHQSTIKALTQHQLSPDSVLVVTGGDDNALAFTLLRWNGSAEEAEMHTSTLLVPRAHASAVTALALIPDSDSSREDGTETRFTVVSSSNDQRIKVWEVMINNGATSIDGVQVRRVANVPTAVADVSSLHILEDGNEGDGSARRRIIVCGVGMDIWRFSPHKV
ncbi:WD repeat-containing protein 6 [Coniosporium apollinis]|uniref:WD repeat-containing protein 6 n=1 Tax=Coniosporium apollinis TaxID=61459 RepID=A0ABQ9NTA4_9PEZI|nr:WD repeat-containing protein 6 [Coniosporium apollinis]